MHLRPATPDDANAIAAVHLASWRAAYAGILPAAFLAGLSQERRARSWHDILQKQASQTWVAQRPAGIAGSADITGFVSFGACRDAGAADSQGEVWSLYARPDDWGQGVGRVLLQQALGDLRRTGRPDVSLWVLSENRRGLQFYQRFGFQPVAGSAKMMELGGAQVEEVCLRLADPTRGGADLSAAPPVQAGDITLQPLAELPQLQPLIQSWFEAEWPGYYGPEGRGNAAQDVAAYCRIGALPLGLVALLNGQPCGFAALKAEPFPTHPHLGPWAGAAYVVPALRRRGVGLALLRALETQALQLGHRQLYCATATSDSLLRRAGWQPIEAVTHEGATIGIYQRSV